MPPDSPSRAPDLEDHAWETEKAPRISSARMILTFAAFGLWLAVLAWMAARRWFGSLL